LARSRGTPRASRGAARPAATGTDAEDPPFAPYVPAAESPPEFTLRAVLLGAFLSITFGMVNAYLGLRVGLTVSASIPSAVISMAVLRGILRRGTVLENNIVHAVGSTGESLAAGVVFTVPALLFLGLSPSTFTVFLLGVTAGLLGILTMIPLRRELMLHEHAILPYPEGTACAQVLIAGDRGGASARPVFLGMAVGAAYQVAIQVLGLWRERVTFTARSLHKATIGFDLTPIFLGVGYIIGPRIAAVMASGGILAWCVLVPLFDIVAGTPLGLLLEIPATASSLDAAEIWRSYVRFVGAGAVTMGGVISVVGVIPTARAALAAMRDSLGGAGPSRAAAVHALRARPRTDRDLPPQVVLFGVAACGLALWLLPQFGLGLIETLLALVFSAFFVVVSARIVGLVGTTSQPISGMTITALLATSLVLAALGHRGQEAMAASITVGAVVAISIALAGDLAQDLKTGALLGATPSRLQLAQIIGTTAAAVRAGWVLLLLHRAYGIGSATLPAPQARLLATLVQGVAEGHLPWMLMAFGAGLAALVQAFGVPSLAFAIGLYLPVTTTAPLLVGGLVRLALARRATRARLHDSESNRSVLVASGMVAGDALAGIGGAGIVVLGYDQVLRLREAGSLGALEPWLTIAMFALLVWFLARSDRRGDRA
jgi:putative OPT family oligopeptide transporter